MKHRAFFFTLLLFLLFFHGSIFIVAAVSLEERIEAAKQQSLSAQQLLGSSLLGDIQALESRGKALSRALDPLLSAYANIARSEGARLALYQGPSPLWDDIGKEDLASLAAATPADESRTLTLREGEKPALLVAGRLPAPYEEYLLFYQADITETLAGWRSMKNQLFLAGAFFSALLAGSLLLLFHRLFQPLEQVSTASCRIAQGDYDYRLPATGRDELTEMSRNFNTMAQKIQEQMEALQAAALQKQRFVDNFAHELRTPLTAIYGYGEYLQRAVLSEEDKLTATGYILSQCRRLQNMAGQLLELATTSGDKIRMEQVSVEPLLADVESALGPKAAQRQVTLCFEAALPTLWGSRELLESLLMNLLENALHACEPGGQVLVRAEKEGESPILTVQDNGRGMTQEQLDHVREPFYRVDKARSRREGGAGLGLALCQQIVDIHKARFILTSVPGKGTKATVIFTTS